MTQGYLPGVEGAELRRDLSQFYTPRPLADRLAGWFPRAQRVLEPAAGRGALIAPMLERSEPPGRVVAYDVDPHNCEALRALGPVEVRERDFLADDDPGRFDLGLMNPPYESTDTCPNGQDVAFALRALQVCHKVGGLFQASMEHSIGRFESFWKWVDIRRRAVISSRWKFGGAHSPKTNFVALELRLRTVARKQGEPTTLNQEWWP